MRARLILGLMMVLGLSFVYAMAENAPAMVDVKDNEALSKAVGTKITVTGKVKEAKWSSTGKVMNVYFEDADKFIANAFEKNRDKLDKAFGGDFAKSLVGATVKISGKVEKYGGKSEKMKDYLQLVITDSTQVTMISGGTATTQPSDSTATPSTSSTSGGSPTTQQGN